MGCMSTFLKQHLNTHYDLFLRFEASPLMSISLRRLAKESENVNQYTHHAQLAHALPIGGERCDSLHDMAQVQRIPARVRVMCVFV